MGAAFYLCSLRIKAGNGQGRVCKAHPPGLFTARHRIDFPSVAWFFKQNPCLCRDRNGSDYTDAYSADGRTDEDFILSGCVGIGRLAGIVWHVSHMAIFAKRIEEVLISGPCSVLHRYHDWHIFLFWASVN